MHTNSARTSMVFIMASNPEKNKKDMSGSKADDDSKKKDEKKDMGGK